jgi:hypothetical protein
MSCKFGSPQAGASNFTPSHFCGSVYIVTVPRSVELPAGSPFVAGHFCAIAALHTNNVINDTVITRIGQSILQYCDALVAPMVCFCFRSFCGWVKLNYQLRRGFAFVLPGAPLSFARRSARW